MNKPALITAAAAIVFMNSAKSQSKNNPTRSFVKDSIGRMVINALNGDQTELELNVMLYAEKFYNSFAAITIQVPYVKTDKDTTFEAYNIVVDILSMIGEMSYMFSNDISNDSHGKAENVITSLFDSLLSIQIANDNRDETLAELTKMRDELLPIYNM